MKLHIYMYQRSRNLSYFKILTSSKKWTFPLENDPFRIFPPPFCILHHCTFHLTPKLGYNTQNTACTINCLVNLLRTDIPLSIDNSKSSFLQNYNLSHNYKFTKILTWLLSYLYNLKSSVLQKYNLQHNRMHTYILPKL